MTILLCFGLYLFIGFIFASLYARFIAKTSYDFELIRWMFFVWPITIPIYLLEKWFKYLNHVRYK
jgi:cellobiose-specific phosphotransferase system component IIC